MRRRRPNLLFAGILFFTAAAASGASVPGGCFAADMKAAMDRMMGKMMRPPTGDVDRDFVAMMTPHHQGAIDMAVAELRYGQNEHLKRIAQEIIVDQQQEIAAMRMALGQPLLPSNAAPTGPNAAPRHIQMEH